MAASPPCHGTAVKRRRRLSPPSLTARQRTHTFGSFAVSMAYKILRRALFFKPRAVRLLLFVFLVQINRRDWLGAGQGQPRAAPPRQRLTTSGQSRRT